MFSFENMVSALKLHGLTESFVPPMILNMSITASVIILFVLLARLPLKKAPKVFSYALWSVVLFRLLCPVSVTTDFSLLGFLDTPALENTGNTTAMEYIPYDVVHTRELEFHLPVAPSVNEVVNQALPQEYAALGADPMEGPMAVASLIWLTGVGAMGLYSVFTYLSLRRRLVGAVCLRDNIYLADHIGSPFVMGLFRPKIYLPSSLSQQEQGYIILHEQHHIRRLDHMVKALAFIALCIHWFNPLVWAAFVLSSKDMEMSCDEAVIKQLGETVRADYSASLLSLATGRRIIAGTPLAFGEGDTKGRVKNVLNWKKPKVWITVAVGVFCVVMAAACAVNPALDGAASDDPASDSSDNSPAQTQFDVPESQPPTVNVSKGDFGTVADLSYYLELAAPGKEFRDMALEKRVWLLVEYEDLLDDYILIARETTDGKGCYIVGAYNGDPARSPLHGMYSVEYATGGEEVRQLLYRESDAAGVEQALAEGRTPSEAYILEDSRLTFSDSPGVVLIQPREGALTMDIPFHRYLYVPNGREYIADAAGRGIDLCGGDEPYLEVYLISQRYGEIAERISLTETETAAILEEERQPLTVGYGFSATLHTGGEVIYYNEREGAPQTVLDLAVERCNYQFAAPSFITGDILEARLECGWLESPLYADAAHLPRLGEILRGAEFGYVGGCGYGAALTLTLADGEKLTVFKGTDGCDTMVFGSFGGYFLGDQENIEFWEMFGLDAETKEPLIQAPQGAIKVFEYQGLRLEVTNVVSSRTATVLAEGIQPHDYTIFTCAPGASVRVLDPGMSEPGIYEDGLPHPQWGLSYTGETERTRITEDTGGIAVTADLEGVYHLESSLFVLQLELMTPRIDE